MMGAGIAYVSAMAGIEVVLIDATQGIQAQTIANYELAKKEKLRILPVLNKIDMATDLDQVRPEVKY